MNLEKIAEAMMKNAAIQSVHFNDIHDNEHVYVGADGAHAAQETAQTKEEEALLPFILDDKERSKTARALRVCANTGQVAVLARTLYLEEILPSEVLRGADFHRAILPLLPFTTTETALKQAILKQVK